ncbi:WAP four-disulfide core domain protein 12-like [Homarus americanus]|uniref:WAP four-disulfide core domain protein 12-like n=1 Tax=Homarus americanus TaxID=6706 RepID=UPI001C46B9FC|nr:WAP four-disulfide core domain protein 12-like [Homarus americanus]
MLTKLASASVAVMVVLAMVVVAAEGLSLYGGQKPGECPLFPAPPPGIHRAREFSEDTHNRDCESDRNCLGTKKCCSTGVCCGRVCVEPSNNIYPFGK